MLKLMRDNLKYFSWLLGFVVVAFVFAVFADYGGQGNFLGSSTTSDWVAQVEGKSITMRQFLESARNVDAYYRRLLGDSYDPQRLNLRIGQQAINQLVQEEVILASARDLGLKATANEISSEIVRDPSLRGDNGFIGVDRYKSLLRQNNIDPAEYELDISRRLLRRKWMDLITADVMVRDADIIKEIRRQDESADVQYTQFKVEDFKAQVDPSDADVEKFFASEQERYVRGEGRSFDLLMFDRLQMQEKLEVAEEDVRALYDASIQTRFTIPEQRRASHILFKTAETATEDQYQVAREAAGAARARVLGGEDFAAVATEVSEDTSAANGGDLGFFRKGVMTLPFEQATWRLETINDVSAVVQTQFGYHVIKLTGRSEPKVRPFEEVREELQQEVSFQKAGDAVRDQAREFVEALRANPEAFRDEAARRNLVRSDSGIIHDGEVIPGAGLQPDAARALFGLTAGEVTAPIAVPRGYLVARFLESHPGGTPPLEEIKEQVQADYILETAQARAVEEAGKAVKAAAGKTLQEIGEKRNLEVSESAAWSRGTALGTLGVQTALETVIFSGELNTALGPIELPAGPVVLMVTAREELTPENITSRVPAVRNQLLATQRQLVLASVTRELSTAADVRYNTEVIARYDNPGAATP